MEEHIKDNFPLLQIAPQAAMPLWRPAIFALRRAKFAPQAKLACASEIACGQ